jgi:flagellar biosynthesis protein
MNRVNRPGDRNYRLSDAAVALSADPSGVERPRIVASGRGAVAEQILALAFATGVKVREDPDLVEILSVLDLDSEIPIEALALVSEILSYVYRSNAAPAGVESTEGPSAPVGSQDSPATTRRP